MKQKTKLFRRENFLLKKSDMDFYQHFLHKMFNYYTQKISATVNTKYSCWVSSMANFLSRIKTHPEYLVNFQHFHQNLNIP